MGGKELRGTLQHPQWVIFKPHFWPSCCTGSKCKQRLFIKKEADFSKSLPSKGFIREVEQRPDNIKGFPANELGRGTEPASPRVLT